MSVVVPPPPCAVPAWAARIAQAVGMPAGIEYAPEVCERSPRAASGVERLTLTGRTAREALTEVFALDPRYRWVESNGVLVVRTGAAASDRSHFLHRASSTFHLDAVNMAGALHAIQSALGTPGGAGPDQSAGRTPQSNQPISVNFASATSVLEALNAVVRTHGAMRWRVSYCAREARHEFATIGLDTYDGSGLDVHSAVLRDAGGKLIDACRPRR